MFKSRWANFELFDIQSGSKSQLLRQPHRIDIVTCNPINSRSQSCGHDTTAVILAAGKGTRMNSDLPKVMHCAFGKPLVEWVVDVAVAAGAKRVILVVGHQEEVVRAHFRERSEIEFVTQSPQLGTGHAVDQARALLQETPRTSELLVLCGDGPLITTATAIALLKSHRDSHAAATLATSIIPDATGYGRIDRDSRGDLKAIVEQKDCTRDQLAIHEVNPSYYCFELGALMDTLAQVDNRNAAGEYYITDVFHILKNAGRIVRVVDAVPADEVLSVNTPEQLAEVADILRSRGLAAEPASRSTQSQTETRR